MERRGFSIDLHAHTRFSDAVFSPNQKIIQATYRAGLDVVAVTDHETTRGVQPMVDDVDRFNEENETALQVFRGIEFRTRFSYNGLSVDADIVAGHLGENEAFLSWAERHQATYPDTVSTIKACVLDHGALVVIPHAGLNAANSIPIEVLPYLYDQLGDIRNNVPLEVVNSSENSFPGAADRRMRRKKFALEHGITPVANSDGHYPGERGRDFTILQGISELNHTTLMQAIMSGNTSIVESRASNRTVVTAFMMVNASLKNAYMTKKFPINLQAARTRQKMIAEVLANLS